METRIGIVFPGQGSQYVGMGKDLFEKYPEVREVFETGNKVTGIDLARICFEGPMEVLTETSNCQVAIFAVSIACFKVFMKEFPRIPSFFAGHSLGEYTALAASGAFSLKDGFMLVSKRAGFMKAAADETPGTMAAVLGMDENGVRKLVREFPGIEISNINAPGQIVVGGRVADIECFMKALRERKVKAIQLKVSGAFHTSLMKKASAMLAAELEKTDILFPDVPVYANCTGERISDSASIRRYLLLQLTSSEQWVKTIRNASAGGCAVVELGPKNVLSGLIRKIDPDVRVFNIDDSASLNETVNRLIS